MKAFFNKTVNKAEAIWKDESGQGATEYILLLVVVVALALAFKPKITEFIGTKTDAIGSEIKGFDFK